MHYIKPFTAPVLSTWTQKDIVLGKKIPCKPNNTTNILIYSDKLHESYASSQECFVEIIKSLAKRYNCWLVSDHTKQVSDYYKSIAPYFGIDTSSTRGIKDIEEKLEKINPAIIVPITENGDFELLAKRSSLYSIHAEDNLFRKREVDYRLLSSCTKMLELPWQK